MTAISDGTYGGLLDVKRSSWMGRKERWYWGLGLLVILCGLLLAYTAPGTLMGFAAVVGAIGVPLYGGALGKLYVEMKNGNGKSEV
jgi:hypothetical protein